MAHSTHILDLLAAYFDGRTFAPSALVALKRGRFGNAVVYRYRDSAAAVDWIIKDFHHSPWWMRLTFARFFIKQEYRALSHLQGLPGIASEVHRLSPLTVIYPYVQGTSLAGLPKNSVPKTFFLEMETIVEAMHARGMVHLDLRNLGNILCSDDGHPHLIDFQSAFRLPRWTPKWLRRVLCNADRSGIYKSWARRGTEPLDPEREAFLRRANRIRKLWILRGYPLSKFKRWLKKKFARKPTPPPPPAPPPHNFR
ncbi:hypothetical protein Ga0100230_018715 [Opitutaceae bacterium TAV3]|nr:hypothetical protein Ga0100230_018715 [Opitutaceae bacterium TAV3]